MATSTDTKQTLPPELSYDTLYLYPDREYEKSKQAHQAHLAAQQTLLKAETDRQRAEEREAEARHRALEAQQRKDEMEQDLLKWENQREQEKHSQALQSERRQFEATKKENETLKSKATEATKAQKTAEADKRATDELVTTLLQWGLGLCCILAVVSVFGGYRWGFSHGYKADIEAQVAHLSQEKTRLQEENTSLHSQISSLTPSPPDSVPLDADAVKKVLVACYHNWDEAHNEERLSRLVKMMDPQFVVQTDGFENDLAAWKRRVKEDFFGAGTLHQQITQMGEPTKSTPDSSSGSDSTSSVSKSDAESKTDTASKPFVTIVDHDTVEVSVVRQNYFWKSVLVPATPPAPTVSASKPDADSSSSGDASESSDTTAPNPEPPKPPTPPSPTRETQATERRTRAKETWKRKQGEWYLVKSETLSVGETSTNQAVPTRKCRNLSCGEYYVTGAPINFSEDGDAIKVCPHCGRPLYFAKEGE